MVSGMSCPDMEACRNDLVWSRAFAALIVSADRLSMKKEQRLLHRYRLGSVSETGTGNAGLADGCRNPSRKYGHRCQELDKSGNSKCCKASLFLGHVFDIASKFELTWSAEKLALCLTRGEEKRWKTLCSW